MTRVLSFLSSAILLALLSGCAPPYVKNDSGQEQPDLPEITQEIIEERINHARVYDVLPESGTGNQITWSFDEDEPKEIVVIDKKVNGPAATLILDIKTQSSPRSKNLRHLAGQIRTEWQLKSGMVLRRWQIVDTENISMKYRDLPKPATPQDLDR